jgi:hypothetical protein
MATLAAGALLAATLGDPGARSARALQRMEPPAQLYPAPVELDPAPAELDPAPAELDRAPAELSPVTDEDTPETEEMKRGLEPIGPIVLPSEPVPGPAEAQPCRPAPAPPAAASMVIDLVVAAAAQRASVDAAAVRVVSAQPVDWPDAGLGCGQLGMAFAQVVTPGYLVVVDIGGTRLTYHTDAARRVIACDRPTRILTPG